MYRTGRRSAPGIANWVRRDSIPNSNPRDGPMHHPARTSDVDEEYEPIYYPRNPSEQAQRQESAAPTQPSPFYGDYASSDGYRSLMAFNSQQRTAGKLSRRDEIPSEEVFARRDDHPLARGGGMLQDRTSTQQVKSYPGASSLGYLLGGV